MREIDVAFAKVAEAIRAQGPVPGEVIAGLEMLRGSVGRWLSGAASVLCAPKHGLWVVSPTGVYLDLSRRPTLRRLIKALVEGRVTRPGQALSAAELIAAGWPEECAGPDASANRLRVALCRLRQFGLDTVIITANSGWMLDANIPLVRDETQDLLLEEDRPKSGIFPAVTATTAELSEARRPACA